MRPHETVGDFADERQPERGRQAGEPRAAPQAAGSRQEERSRGRAHAPRAIRVYQRWRAAVGVLVVGLLFAGGWLLNGYFTAQVVATAWGDWWLGWAVHLIITAIELTTTLLGPVLRRIRAPAWVHALLWTVVLPFGLVDTGSSALGLMQWALMLRLPVGLPLSAGVTLAAELIAFVPEPMLVWLVLAFYQVVSE